MFLSYFIGETDVLIFNEKGSKVIQACTSRSYAHALSLNTGRLVGAISVNKVEVKIILLFYQDLNMPLKLWFFMTES